MTKKDIIFWIGLFGFFGITGLDIINGLARFINELYLEIGEMLWVLIIAGVWIYKKDRS